MKEQFVYDPLISKRQQYLLATQLVRAVLKIGAYSVLLVDPVAHFHSPDDVITAGEADE
jgi:T-complex protein 1 subunit epsilon